jgi:hypothetical protein
MEYEIKMRTVLLCGVFWLLTMAARAEPVAMICHLAGKAEVSHGAGAWTAARLLQKLEKGDRVRCLTGGEAGIVMMRGGQRFLLPTGQSATVSDTAIDGAKLIAGLRAPSLEATNKLEGRLAGGTLARYGNRAADLVPSFHGWLSAETKRFEFAKTLFENTKVGGYNFSLWNQNGYILWNAHTREALGESASKPVVVDATDLPAMKTRTPYIWRLDAINPQGGSTSKFVWGIITFLTPEEARQLEQETADLTRQAKDDPKDAATTILLAQRYREFGVHQYALDLLGTLYSGLESAEAIEAAEDDLCHEAGRFALLCRGLAIPKEEQTEKQ